MAFRNQAPAPPPSISQVTSGTIDALFLIGDASGAHAEIGTDAAGHSGIRLYDSADSLVVDLSALTGDATFSGTVQASTIESSTIDSPSISGGTISSATLDSTTINSSAIDSATISSPSISGGTISGSTFDLESSAGTSQISIEAAPDYIGNQAAGIFWQYPNGGGSQAQIAFDYPGNFLLLQTYGSTVHVSPGLDVLGETSTEGLYSSGTITAAFSDGSVNLESDPAGSGTGGIAMQSVGIFGTTTLNARNSGNSAYSSWFAQAFNAESDASVKTGIAPYSGGLDVVKAVPTSTYRLTADPTTPRVGFIAQDMPDVIRRTSEYGTLAVDLSATVAVLWQAVRELEMRGRP